MEVENSEHVKFVTPTLMVPQKVQWSGFSFTKNWLKVYISTRPKSRQVRYVHLLKKALINPKMNKKREKVFRTS